MCSAEGGAQLLLCPACVCSGRKAVCGEAVGLHPQGDGICAQLLGTGGGGMNEPFEWKTLVLSMTLSSGCGGGALLFSLRWGWW